MTPTTPTLFLVVLTVWGIHAIGCGDTVEAFGTTTPAFLVAPIHHYHHHPNLRPSSCQRPSLPSLSKRIFTRGIALTASSSEPPYETKLTRISEEEEGIPIPFVDRQGNSFIECYADSVATVDGVEYTIGVPCDYCVALCYMGDSGSDDVDNLVPVELTDELMDDIFPIAENIVTEEFGEELVLQRTPQTLTLVGELEEDDDEDDEDDDEDDDDDDEYDGEEEVEVLLTFEHRDKEYNLVRLMDPVLLVGKTDPERADLRVLLTPEESDKVMPLLETAFLKFHEGGNDMLP